MTEYTFFVYVHSEPAKDIGEIYFIKEDEMDAFAGELYDPEFVSFTGVVVRAASQEEAVYKYKTNDVLVSDEPKQTIGTETRTVLKHVLPRSIKEELFAFAVGILNETRKNEMILQKLAMNWAANTTLTKDQTLECLRTELREMLEGE